jgi:DNA-binding HxlR family transcriptional regulator
MKKISTPPSVYSKLEDVIGCKWSVSVLHAVREGITRPGALEREIAGISTKVLSERLRKLTQYGLLKRQVFAEAPPRTEYSLTTSGRQLIEIIEQIKQLDLQIQISKPDDINTH